MCIWVLGLLAFIGNLLVIVWRVRMKDDNKVQSIMLVNLACADFLMGVYLLIIATKDIQWTGEYFKHDVQWRRGHLCQFAGALSVLSSEVSVFTLSVITADRLICVVFALRIRPLSCKVARIVCTCVWILGIIISFVPMTGISYFWDEQQQIGFFGRSAVCLPFQLSQDRSAGWQYSVTFFMALNGAAFVFILAAYVVMFWTALRLVRSLSGKHMIKAESTRATRLFCIVLTDFFCWMPVIILGILSLTGDFHDPKQSVYVWIAVFVLPVNSSINPILYTFSTIGVRRKIEAKFRTRKDQCKWGVQFFNKLSVGVTRWFVLIKEWSILSVRTSSSGCTRIVGRARCSVASRVVSQLSTGAGISKQTGNGGKVISNGWF